MAEELRKEMSDAMARVNMWASTKEKELNNIKIEHTSFLDTQNDLTQRLKQREREAKNKMEKLMQEINKHQEGIRSLKVQNDSLKGKSEELPSELKSLQEELEMEKENYKTILNDLDSQDSSMRRKKHALEMGHELYETRLGLKFDKTNDGSLVFKMRNIDPSFPSREFSFSIRVEEDEKYHVMHCNPEIDGLDQLVAVLNDTNSLSHFVRSVRQSWRQPYAK
ncbi:hypothetical protein GUITHDRAFT_113666 [Guillardia theta CCMP2712]|uniref:Kinetochore protein SPC25 n=1 Tax=Guillardia theta (strain CCMP2712) TaxID=905079 RepID=L1IVA9_GUITC|nr:hypothetical protein GUITHDRAFT_113666 [Guillardia theta CCMP2712]EKX40188.1 hypothetical protein GUITHDRAFT_113666 [Guillardia theta CCMP2712]|eukprot:XP_005827168.1 hypothetical protein GUITHDRAFT_113666 [Guillardia theta CCMP2712]